MEPSTRREPEWKMALDTGRIIPLPAEQNDEPLLQEESLLIRELTHPEAARTLSPLTLDTILTQEQLRRLLKIVAYS